MSKFIIRNIELTEAYEGDVLSHQPLLSLAQFIHACGQNEQWIQQLIEYDIIHATQQYPHQHVKNQVQDHIDNVSDSSLYFFAQDVSRARQAYRLQRDFDASFTAIAVMLDLIEEVQQLRREINYRTLK